MKGDFTRDTFDARDAFSRVLMQQGRVTLDADFNEQVDILLAYVRTLARDLIGPYGAPYGVDAGFRIDAGENGIMIGEGRYYVDGIPVKNEKACLLTEQPYYKIDADDPIRKLNENKDQWFWLYLDVWERHVTSIEAEGICEPALGGPDTCARAQVVWQVKAMLIDPEEFESYGYYYGYGYGYGYGPYGYDPDPTIFCPLPMKDLTDLSKVLLAAQVDPGKKTTDPCVTSPDSKYLGVENHLYRVEIHKGGATGEATFKWSRDNGSTVTAWLGTKSQSQGVTELVVRSTRGFSAGCWVEITDEDDDLQERPGPLVKVAKVQGGTLSLESDSLPAAGLPDPTKLRHPKVRRWDQTEKGDIVLDEGAIEVTETNAAHPDQSAWFDLEDGIQVAFAPMPNSDGKYRSGDYWLIPARVASGTILWPAPRPNEAVSFRPPRGVRHHYAPLGFVGWEDGDLKSLSCLCEFAPNNSCLRRKSLRTFGPQNMETQPRVTEEMKALQPQAKEAAAEPAPARRATPAVEAAAAKPAKRRSAKKQPT
jgi:Family of unknown function (DUF6519)